MDGRTNKIFLLKVFVSFCALTFKELKSSHYKIHSHFKLAMGSICEDDFQRGIIYNFSPTSLDK
jgi:hypothetical protein